MEQKIKVFKKGSKTIVCVTLMLALFFQGSRKKEEVSLQATNIKNEKNSLTDICKQIYYHPDSVQLLLDNTILSLDNAYTVIDDCFNNPNGCNKPSLSIDEDCLLIPFYKTGKLPIKIIWNISSKNDVSTSVVTLILFGSYQKNVEKIMKFGIMRFDISPIKEKMKAHSKKLLIKLIFYRAPENNRELIYNFN